jgi:predicted phosphodiesterase
MKIAFISDIHANLPALEAVFEDLDQQKPDHIYCLGDLIGYHIWPEETVRLIRERNIPTLMGTCKTRKSEKHHPCTDCLGMATCPKALDCTNSRYQTHRTSGRKYRCYRNYFQQRGIDPD